MTQYVGHSTNASKLGSDEAVYVGTHIIFFDVVMNFIRVSSVPRPFPVPFGNSSAPKRENTSPALRRLIQFSTVTLADDSSSCRYDVMMM